MSTFYSLFIVYSICTVLTVIVIKIMSTTLEKGDMAVIQGITFLMFFLLTNYNLQKVWCILCITIIPSGLIEQGLIYVINHPPETDLQTTKSVALQQQNCPNSQIFGSSPRRIEHPSCFKRHLTA